MFGKYSGNLSRRVAVTATFHCFRVLSKELLSHSLMKGVFLSIPSQCIMVRISQACRGQLGMGLFFLSCVVNGAKDIAYTKLSYILLHRDDLGVPLYLLIVKEDFTEVLTVQADDWAVGRGRRWLGMRHLWKSSWPR